jgi:sugar lactone lactonase YvrE
MSTRKLVEGLELVLDAHAIVGEGPVWSVAEQALYWVDVMANLVHRYDPQSKRDETFDVGQPVGALALREAGGLVLALRDGFAEFDPGSGRPSLIAEVEAGDPNTRMNDGKCDRAGRFWAGTMGFLERDGECAGSLFRLDPDHQVTCVLTGVTVSNGLDWTADDRLMYYIDTPTGGVDVFDFDATTGQISGRRRLVTIAPEDGMPDGMTLDAEGYLWVALWGGWAVRRYAPNGTLDRVVELPVSQVSCCTFGGPDLSDLYITSATEGFAGPDHAREPLAGALFRYRPGVSGRAASSYKG